MERRIVSLGRAGKTDQALEFFASLPRPSLRQVNAAIDACARARPVRLDEAFTLLQTAALTHTPNVYTFGSLMNACARAGNVPKARRVLRDMYQDYGVRPNAVVYHAAVKACDRATSPQPDVAWQLLAEAREIGLALSVVGYNTAMSAAARAGHVQEAVALLDLMNTSGDDPLVPQPDAVTYGTVLAVFERAGEWQQLMTFSDRMQAEGHALDGMAITSILHACQHLGLAAEARHYLERMKSVGPYRRQTAGSQVAGSRAPIQGPDAVAYLLAISACARGGEWQEGIQLLADYDLHGGSADVAVYTAAVRGCELAGEFAAALTLVERMRQLRIEPNEMTFAAVMGACATACARAKDEQARQVPLHKALRLLRVLKKDPSTIDPNIQIYNAAIRAAAESLQMEQAFRLVDDVKAQGLEANVVTFGTLMSAAERAGSLDGVSRVFQRMREAGVEANEVVYGAALSCCRKAGDAERALLLLRKMIRDGLTVNIVTFNTVLTAQVEVKGRGPKELDRAMIVFQLVCSNAYSDAGPNRQTYNLMVRFLAECQRPREAEVLLHKMRCQDGLIPDVDLYTSVVTVYERSGQPLKALRLMESMNVDGYDFYEAKVLNAAFKRALKVANVVGRGFTSSGGRVPSGNDNGDTGGGTDPPNFATLQQSQKESERFLQGKRIQGAE
jgi:pentatricopeptide repeat domain-containing protein 1